MNRCVHDLLVGCAVCSPAPDRPRTIPAPSWDGLTERILDRREHLRHQATAAAPAKGEEPAGGAE